MRQEEDEEDERCHNSSISACVSGTAVTRCPLAATRPRPVDSSRPCCSTARSPAGGLRSVASEAEVRAAEVGGGQGGGFGHVCLSLSTGLEPPRTKRRRRAVISLDGGARARALLCWVLSGSGNVQAMTSQSSDDVKNVGWKRLRGGNGDSAFLMQGSKTPPPQP